MTFEDALQKTIAWYSKVSTDWWDVGTDSALSAHPEPKGISKDGAADAPLN